MNNLRRVNRSRISRAALLRFYRRSGERCNFPGCTAEPYLDDGTPILQIAHINAIAPGGPRHDPNFTRDTEDNLILLCPNHHFLVDKEPEKYSAEWLRQAKYAHQVDLATKDAHPESPATKSVDNNTCRSKQTPLEEGLEVWQNHRHNSSEEFWQGLFERIPELLASALGGRAYTLNSRCYVGGKRLDNKGARVLDFLAQYQRNVALIEIKTPATSLIGSQYRDSVFTPSRELSGACVQVLDYRSTLIEHLHHLKSSNDALEVSSPTCFVIAGDTMQLSASQARSFELYRCALKDVAVLTYDELFDGVELLVKMMSNN